MVTNPLHLRDGHRAQTIYTQALRAAYQHGIQLQDPDWSQHKEPEVWDVAQRDPVVRHAIDARLHRVAGGDPQIQPGSKAPTPADKATAAAIEQIVVETLDDKLFDAKRHLASSVFRGRAVTWIEGERRPMMVGGVHGQWWVPTRVEQIDKRAHRFVAVKDSQGRATGKRRHELFSIRTGEWKPIPDAYLEQLMFMGYDDDQSRLGHGRGILEAVWMYLRAKGHVFRFQMQGLERWAKGIIHVGVSSEAEAVTANETTRNNYEAAFRNMADEGVLVTDARDSVSLLTGAGEGYQQVSDAKRELDEGITQLILGSLLPTGGGGDVGSNARAEVEQESTESLLGSDRRKIDGVISRRLIGLAYHKNLHLLRRMPEGPGACPKLRSVSPKSYDPEEQGRVILTAKQAGMAVVKSEAYERLGLTMPDVDDEVIEPDAPLMAGAGALGLPGIDFDA